MSEDNTNTTKKPRGITEYVKSLTPEQKKEFYIQRGKKRRENRLAKQKIKEKEANSVYAKAELIVATKIAKEIADNAGVDMWTPDQDLTDKIISLVNAGVPYDEIRTLIGADARTWEKITKHVGHSQTPNKFSVASEVYFAKKKRKMEADEFLDILKQERKNHLYNQKQAAKKKKDKARPTTPTALLSLLQSAHDKKYEADLDFGKLHTMMNAHDKKSQAPTITIKTTVPRPDHNQVVTVTETKQVDDETLSKLKTQLAHDVSDGSNT